MVLKSKNIFKFDMMAVSEIYSTIKPLNVCMYIMATNYKNSEQTGQVLLKTEQFHYSISIYLTGLGIF